MNHPHQPLVLQSRWRPIESDGTPSLLYYGVRNPPHQRRSLIPISASLAALLGGDQRPLNPEEQTPAVRTEMAELAAHGILVPPEHRHQLKTPETMQVCSRCVVNDYVVPGLEFDETGVCALCRSYEVGTKPARSAFATIDTDELVATASTSRFDAMVLYTGGKDSSYMLWLLARKLGLRVLAAFWNMPYCSDAAYDNINRARQRLDNVEFVEWTLPLATVREAMRDKWHHHGWPCLCPSVAFAMLYPLAAQLRIPYVFLGLEDVQTAVLDYVVGTPAASSAPPPSRREQTLAFLATRALPRQLKPPLRWPDEMSNYHAAVRNAMPTLFHDLAELVQQAQQDRDLDIPLICRLATNEEYGSWDDARRIIEKEMDWRAPVGQNSLLHTSCAIEPVKDYLQFQRFRAMRTVFMPQSIVELGAAVHFRLLSREDALRAVPELGYWQPPAMLGRLVKDLQISHEEIRCTGDELSFSLAEWAAGS